MVSLSNFKKEEVLKLAATADFFSGHPFAKAIVRYAEQNNLAFEKPTEFKEFPGKGITAIYNDKEIIFGRLPFLQEYGIKIGEEQFKKINSIRQEGIGSLLFVSYNNQLIGYIFLVDEIRPETKEAIATLKRIGIKNIVMLTGDNERVAEKVAKQTNINIFHANLLPEQKVDFVKKYLNKKYKVAMVGDGVNDAAALALADIGIAMGTIGSDAAIEAADIALMKDNFSNVPKAIKLGISVTKIARQDFWIWGIVNFIGLILVFSKTIGPEGAAAFNFITDFFPIMNSLRLFGYKFSNY